jgi:hypothetical protein
MMVVGDRAGSKWMSDDLLKRAASKDKHMHIVEGSNHMKLYDVYRIAPKARTGYHPRPPIWGRCRERSQSKNRCNPRSAKRQ